MIESGEALHVYGSIYISALIVIGLVWQAWSVSKADKKRPH